MSVKADQVDLAAARIGPQRGDGGGMEIGQLTLDRGDDIVREHTAECFGQHHRLVAERRHGDLRFKSLARFLGRHDVEELLLPCGGAHAGDQIVALRIELAHGHGLTATSVPSE